MLISAKAKDKIAEFLKDSTGQVFRISVDTGGCSGFKYNTEISLPRDDDIVVEPNVVTDPASQPYFANLVVDYVDSIGFSGFTFSNPDATSSCGCGLSFDI